MIGTMRGKSRRRAQKREPVAGGSGRRAGLSVPGVRHEECSGRARYSAVKQGAESVNAGGIADNTVYSPRDVYYILGLFCAKKHCRMLGIIILFDRT